MVRTRLPQKFVPSKKLASLALSTQGDPLPDNLLIGYAIAHRIHTVPKVWVQITIKQAFFAT